MILSHQLKSLGARKSQASGQASGITRQATIAISTAYRPHSQLTTLLMAIVTVSSQSVFAKHNIIDYLRVCCPKTIVAPSSSSLQHHVIRTYSTLRAGSCGPLQLESVSVSRSECEVCCLNGCITHTQSSSVGTGSCPKARIVK